VKSRLKLIGSALAIAGAMAVGACSSDSDNSKPTGLQSSARLAPDTKIHGAWIYRAPQANFSKYKTVIIDPVTLYNGPEANFGDATPADRQKYADIVTAELRRIVGEKNRLASVPGPEVLRIRTTLIGVSGTVGGVATVTRVMPIGIAINAVRGAAGEGGAMTGGIEISFEAHDSQTNELLAGAVRQVMPSTFNIEATLSTSDTVKACAVDAGGSLVDALDKNLAKVTQRAQ
jgi:hypothetical protein